MKKKNTKSLKEIYNESLLCEMPAMNLIPYREDRLEDQNQNIIIAQKYIKGEIGKLLGNIQYIDKINIYLHIYQTSDHGELLSHILINTKSKEIVGFINLITINDITSKEYLATHGIFRTTRANKGLIFEFFTKWLLPNYKTVISSNSTTKHGTNFWYKIIGYGLLNNKDCGIFKENKFVQLHKIEDFDSAWDFYTGKDQRIYIID